MSAMTMVSSFSAQALTSSADSGFLIGLGAVVDRTCLPSGGEQLLLVQQCTLYCSVGVDAELTVRAAWSKAFIEQTF